MSRLIIADIKSPVAEGKPLGHFFSVARNYYHLFYKQILTKIAGGPVYTTQFNDELMLLPYNQEQICKRNIKSIICYFRNARTLFKQCNDDIVVVQQGGDVTFFVACWLFFRKSKNKLFLIQYSASSLNSKLKMALYSFAKSKIDGIICPNDDVGIAFGIPYCVVPDYIYTEGILCVNNIPYEERKYDICLLGRLSEEKGAVEFLEHFASAQYSILIAGLPANKTIAGQLCVLANGHENITLRLEVLSDTEYNDYLCQSRFCVLNYQGEYSRRSSGVVLDMIFHDVPIIGLDCQALEFVKRYRMGYIYKDLRNLDLKSIIMPEMHKSFVAGIANYKKTHKSLSQKLGSFLGISKNI